MLVFVENCRSMPSPSKLVHGNLRCPPLKHPYNLCLPISNVERRGLGCAGDSSVATRVNGDDWVCNLHREVWCSSFRQSSVLLRDW